MVLQSIKYNAESSELEVLDQLLLPENIKYLKIKGVEDGWSVINKMQVNSQPNNLFVANIVAQKSVDDKSINYTVLFCRFAVHQLSR
jgi:methylthioribose-1-phosphate isomerase